MKTKKKPDPARVEELKRRLCEVGELIDASKSDGRALYAERIGILVDLRDAGVSREEMATLAGVSPGMVKVALAEEKRRRSLTA